jgi:DNA replication protein DnaC
MRGLCNASPSGGLGRLYSPAPPPSTGATGTGKTYLACALAQQACRKGFRALYRRVPRLFEELILAHAAGTYSRLLSRFARFDVLVLDDWGLAAPRDQDRRDLLEILEDRYGNRSTIITLPGKREQRSHACAVLACRGLDAQIESLPQLLSRRLVLITGKGGVGRSTVTAALAHVAQRAGKRVLVAETSDGSSDYSALAQLFGQAQLPVRAAEVAPGIAGSQLLMGTGVELFLTSVLRIPALARRAAGFEPLKRFLGAAPSFREMGWFFHLLSYLKAEDARRRPLHELILVDMPATGHALALATLPEVLLRVFTNGPVADALREGQAMLQNPAKTAAYVVTLPETLPVSEALELLEGLKQSPVHSAGVIINRVPENIFSAAERDALQPLLARHALQGADGFARIQDAERMVSRVATSTPVAHACVGELDKHGPELVALVAAALEAAPWVRGEHG